MGGLARVRADRPRTWIALLRGVNVGGKHSVSMEALSSFFVEAGATRAQTYIQSGNVLFDAASASPDDIARGVGRLISGRVGFEAPIVLRSGADLERIAQATPYGSAPAKERHVVFLAAPPSADAIKQLDPQRSPGDSYSLIGDEIYLHCPNGLGRSKLTTAYFDRRLQTTATIRNWRSVEALLDLARSF